MLKTKPDQSYEKFYLVYPFDIVIQSDSVNLENDILISIKKVINYLII